MKRIFSNPRIFATFCLLALVLCHLVETGPCARAQGAVETLAVLPFENNAVTDNAKYQPLSKGLAAMLITDLQRAGVGLKVVEREKIAALLKEIALGQSGITDPATAVKAGRILGAQSVAIGSFMVLGPTVRIDARVVKVETSEILLADSVMGDAAAFLGLQQELAVKIAGAMNQALTGTGSKKGGLEAALLYSSGIEALDAGDEKKARTLFTRCIKQDPGYQPLVQSVISLNP
ncbi:MAG: hypothetical protein GY859_10720 [Desulfobacterales bacterium]|nr:hypothetical protein [Desulfobacterales bacterium]